MRNVTIVLLFFCGNYHSSGFMNFNFFFGDSGDCFGSCAFSFGEPCGMYSRPSLAIPENLDEGPISNSWSWFRLLLPGEGESVPSLPNCPSFLPFLAFLDFLLGEDLISCNRSTISSSEIASFSPRPLFLESVSNSLLRASTDVLKCPKERRPVVVDGARSRFDVTTTLWLPCLFFLS